MADLPKKATVSFFLKKKKDKGNTRQLLWGGRKNIRHGKSGKGKEGKKCKLHKCALKLRTHPSTTYNSQKKSTVEHEEIVITCDHTPGR